MAIKNSQIGNALHHHPANTNVDMGVNNAEVPDAPTDEEIPPVRGPASAASALAFRPAICLGIREGAGADCTNLKHPAYNVLGQKKARPNREGLEEKNWR